MLDDSNSRYRLTSNVERIWVLDVSNTEHYLTSGV